MTNHVGVVVTKLYEHKVIDIREAVKYSISPFSLQFLKGNFSVWGFLKIQIVNFMAIYNRTGSLKKGQNGIVRHTQLNLKRVCIW
jgi:hypothetical protein